MLFIEFFIIIASVICAMICSVRQICISYYNPLPVIDNRAEVSIENIVFEKTRKII